MEHHMAVTYGYGKKKFTQALAKACKKLAVYIVKHDKQLKANLSHDAYVCATGMVGCLNTLASFLNESAG
jgi:hypothetical protein